MSLEDEFARAGAFEDGLRAAQQQSTNEDTADVYLQWKGTEACFDFHCPCGTSSHVDAMFAYYVRCPECHVVYQMPTNLEAVPVDEKEHANTFVQGEAW